jgi:hypothetical protein
MISITISGAACLGAFDTRDTETDAYVGAYADAVRDAVARAYGVEVEAAVDWSAPANSISIDGGLGLGDRDAVEETVRAIMRSLWDYPDAWRRSGR